MNLVMNVVLNPKLSVTHVTLPVTIMPMAPHYLRDSSPDSSGAQWHEIGVRVTSLANWIQSQPEDLWCEASPDWATSKIHHMNFLVHESLYTYILLRWS